MDDFDAKVLEELGIFLQNYDSTDNPPEQIVADFEERWKELSPEQKIDLALILMIIKERHKGRDQKDNKV